MGGSTLPADFKSSDLRPRAKVMTKDPNINTKDTGYLASTRYADELADERAERDMAENAAWMAAREEEARKQNVARLSANQASRPAPVMLPPPTADSARTKAVQAMATLLGPAAVAGILGLRQKARSEGR
jgi:hypothetical protein